MKRLESPLLREAERESAPPPGARERVWRSIVAARGQRRPAPLLAGFAFAAALAAAAVVLWPRGAAVQAGPAGAQVSLPSGETLQLAAQADAKLPRSLTLRSGQL